ncbi:uncharacterized protein LOC114123163 isoform X2 [Aphis gossypii]|uniref:uncharacterized protein LOC114123163 isoform X2 n=1 Tax=Aphis gossypii TaxID=80765 RepID=UPI002159A7CC|nr:uncharacterized protein LOC114123163 isoform X2 [Aphis gossypii]
MHTVRRMGCGQSLDKRFPKDSHMRAQWFEQIQKGSKETVNINFETAAVCSLHFPPSSYENKTRAQNMLNYIPIRGRKLKPDAVPLSNCECLETSMHGKNSPVQQSPKICTPSGSFLVTNLADEPTSIEPVIKVKKSCKISLFDSLESDTNFGVEVLAEEYNDSCSLQICNP